LTVVTRNGALTVGTLVNVKAGDYRDGAISNLAFNRWGQDVTAAVTRLDPRRGSTFSAAAGVTLYGLNPATQFRSGTEFPRERAAMQTFRTACPWAWSAISTLR
jgi:hypothetical protein